MTKYFFRAIFSLLFLVACENDGDTLYLSSIEGSDLVATESNVKLSQENSKQVVLSLAWTKETLAISNPNMSAPDVLTIYIQVSTTEDFSSNVIESVATGLSKAYTGAELNTVAKNLAIVPDIAAPVYFRLRSATGSNMESVYSNNITVNVTSYLIDMTIGFILDENKAETETILSSPDSDGIYTGFIGATSWGNFYLLEGDGTIWGNEKEAAPFVLSSNDDNWNCWFPEPQGCYYTIINTQKKLWSALHLPTLKINGDIEAEMSFDRPNNRWIYVFDATSTGDKKIKITTTGKQYDYSTGDKTSTDKPVAFTQDGENIIMVNQATDITVNIPATGESTLVVDLSNPNTWTCKVVNGSLEPDEINEYLYVPGIDDNIRGGWTFDSYLTLYNEDNLAYAGVVDVDSKWGYTFHIEKDNWGDKYTYVSGDAYEGTFTFQGGDNNMPSPAPGLYLVDASLKNLTYKLTGIDDKIYISGLNNNWNFDINLAATPAIGVYSGQITIEFASDHGFSLYMVSDNWDVKFGGSDGKLNYLGSNITDDASLSPGTYTLSVNLINQTYSITQ